jgi:hypothetical protein
VGSFEVWEWAGAAKKAFPGLADIVVQANIVLTVEGGNSLVLHPIGMKSGVPRG